MCVPIAVFRRERLPRSPPEDLAAETDLDSRALPVGLEPRVLSWDVRVYPPPLAVLDGTARETVLDGKEAEMYLEP